MGVAKNLALILIELHNMLSIWAQVFPDQFITICRRRYVHRQPCWIHAP